MPGSSFGTLFRITTWGESHGPALGVVIDGCPAGIPLTPEMIQPYMDRRKPGQISYTTPRKENDQVEILSGVFDGQTTGTPISLLVRNTNQHSGDYSAIADIYRPGHADYTFDAKYGIRDYRGGGRSSGRETLARVAAGAVASILLKELGIEVLAYTRSIGPISLTDPADNSLITREDVMASPIYLPDMAASNAAEQYLQDQMVQQNSVGGTVECVVTGLPAGIGEPVFDKLDARLAQAILSIGAVKGIEFGDGFAAALHTGSENNDAFTLDQDKRICKVTNHSGGVLGGMSDGSPLILRAAFKATPSISRPQQTVHRDGTPADITIRGRHDPVIVPRAVVVVEAMTAITIADLLLQNATARMDYLHQIYR